MITYACQPPETNARSITEDGFTKLGLNPVGDQSPMAAFGISVSTDMISIPGRILPPPALSYKSGKLNVRDGGWNILDVKFHRGASLFPHWAVLVVRDGSNCALSSGNNDDPILTRLIEEFSAKLKKVGINVPNASPRVVWTEWLPHPDQDPGRKAALEILEKTMSARFDPNNKPSFVLVLLSLEVRVSLDIRIHSFC
jgi:eukaryotic translation initiation factor 2C